MIIKINDGPKPNKKKTSKETTIGKKWLKRLHRTIDEYIEDAGLNNERLAQELGLSERHLFRKIKAFTGKSPQKYLSSYRLNIAKEYLENGVYKTVKETSFSVGFRNTSYFIRQFERKFGKKPLQVLREEGCR